MRNTLVHVHSVLPSDYKRMADHNIYVTSGMLWHHYFEDMQKELKETLPDGLNDKSFPLKSYFDNGINVTSHSDFPATFRSPDDPFGIMEIAVTGVYHMENAKIWWTKELLTREQVITALTINCAKQMFLENERGSISKANMQIFSLLQKTC